MKEPTSPISTAGTPVRRLISPTLLREILQRLGPTFVKVGQFLALRPDLIPQSYCDELLKLVDAVEQFPFHIARRIIAEELGDSDQHFAWINPRPVAAASLAQVHLARTLDGDQVAIKVQREGIREIVERDMRRFRRLSRLVEFSGLLPIISAPELVKEVSRWMNDEMDMGLELRNLTRMYELSGDTENFRVPRPYPELSAQRVLTAEFLRGIPFSHLLQLVRIGEARQIEELELEQDQLAATLIHTILVQIFRFQFFHADTHPGNLLAMPGNVVGFVDFGLTETLETTYRAGVMRFVSAVYSNDVEGMIHGLTEVLTRSENTDLESFRADFIAETRIWLRERDVKSDARTSRSSSPTSRYMIGVLRAARRNYMQIPPGILSMYRSLLTAETVASMLGADVDLRSVGRGFFYRFQIENALKLLEPEELQPMFAQLVDLWKDSPGQLRRLLSDLADDRFVLRVHNSETLESRRLANTRARIVATAILSVGIAVLLAGSGQVVIRGIPLSVLLWIALATTYLWIIILWRRLR